MKNYIILVILLLSAATLAAQADESDSKVEVSGIFQNIDVTSNEIVIGKNNLTNSDITCKQYKFPYSIYKPDFDTNKKDLLFVLVNPKKKRKPILALFDLTNHKIKWARNASYGLIYINNKIIEDYSVGAACYSRMDGKKLWGSSKLFYYDSSTAFGVNNEGEMIGIDMNNGKVKWEKRVNNELGWNGISTLNDSTYILVADGLYSININNGSGWKYSSKTTTARSWDHNLARIKSNTSGIAYGYHAFGACSNVLKEKSCIYFASDDVIACLDYSGLKKWETPLPDSIMSSSGISLFGDRILLLNKGYAFSDKKIVFTGKPFIASYNKETGAQDYLTRIDNKSALKDWNTIGDTLLLLFEDTFYKYQLTTGTLLACKNLQDSNRSSYDGIYTKHMFFTNTSDSDFKRFSETYPYDFTLMDQKNSVLKISSDFKETELFAPGHYWLNEGGNHDCEILFNGSKWIIIKKGKKIAELDLSVHFKLIDKMLYDARDNYVNIIDLSDIL